MISRSKKKFKNLIYEHFSEPMAYGIIKEFIDVLIIELLKGNSICIPMLGNFEIKQRQIYNAYAEEYERINTINFLPSRKLKDLIKRN